MQTNNHLKVTINEMNNFMSNNSQLPEDLAYEFAFELRVSRLLIPAVVEDENISFPHILTDEGELLLPLFTDNDELMKYSRDFTAIENDLTYYARLVDELGFAGAIINTESEEFYVDKELLLRLPPLPSNRSGKGYSISKLQKMAKNASNDELRVFMADENNFNNFDEFAQPFMDSVLLNAVVSDPLLVDNESKGIVKRGDVGGFVLATQKNGTEIFALLFTDLDSMGDAYEYYQVCNLLEVIKYVLESDMDGIVINPEGEEYYVPRNILLKLLEFDGLANSKFSKAVDYAFRI
ncbi:SseB family protein [Methanobrevibacter sp.]|uniref:SseB family protein n=1 Tax=Methanobrevibacter sp. TaxID=66852 RepID=UPI00386F8E40